MSLFIQVAVWGAMLAYLWQRLAYMRRRNHATWESLASQLHFASAVGNDIPSIKAAALTAAMEEIGKKSRNPRILWMHFNDARVMLEMADYAERNSISGPASIDDALLASMRRDAMQIRISALIGLGKCVFPQ